MPLPAYNVGERSGPPPRPYTAIDATDVIADAFKKNLSWFIARLHSQKNETISSWTGFKILVRNRIEVSKNVIGYLPTINARPATEIPTVCEALALALALVQSKKIMGTLNLNIIVVVFDQAFYAKATDIL